MKWLRRALALFLIGSVAKLAAAPIDLRLAHAIDPFNGVAYSLAGSAHDLADGLGIAVPLFEIVYFGVFGLECAVFGTILWWVLDRLRATRT